MYLLLISLGKMETLIYINLFMTSSREADDEAALKLINTGIIVIFMNINY